MKHRFELGMALAAVLLLPGCAPMDFAVTDIFNDSEIGSYADITPLTEEQKAVAAENFAYAKRQNTKRVQASPSFGQRLTAKDNRQTEEVLALPEGAYSRVCRRWDEESEVGVVVGKNLPHKQVLVRTKRYLRFGDATMPQGFRQYPPGDNWIEAKELVVCPWKPLM